MNQGSLYWCPVKGQCEKLPLKPRFICEGEQARAEGLWSLFLGDTQQISGKGLA